MAHADDQNPFLSPTTDAREVSESSDVERIRREYLSHEASIKSMGFLYLLGAILIGIYFLVFAISLPAVLFMDGPSGDPVGLLMMVLMTAFCGGMTFLNFWVGRGLRRLDSRVRTPAIVLSAIGLLGIPIGTIISAYFLWLLVSKKGKYVFSPEYQDVMAETPHIKYKTSIIEAN